MGKQESHLQKGPSEEKGPVRKGDGEFNNKEA